MAQRGGKRPGAGKPKGSKASHTLEAATFRKFLIKKVIEEKEPIINALLKSAKKGNIQAIREVLERVLGRVTESLDITTKGNPLSLLSSLKNANNTSNSKNSEPKKED